MNTAYPSKKVTVFCAHCKDAFKLFPCRVNLKGLNFCSKQCWHKHHSEERVCKTCGKDFRVPKSQAEQRPGNGSFCSKKCFNKSKQWDPLKFWKKVRTTSIDECWDWLGTCTGRGYGSCTVNYKSRSSHKMAWELTYGKVPKGLFVCHKCDNPKCCNPYSHLFLGTPKQNSEDMVSKKRQCYGTKCHTNKLNEPEVIEILNLFNQGVKRSKLATQFKVSRTTIELIVKRRIWKNLIKAPPAVPEAEE